MDCDFIKAQPSGMCPFADIGRIRRHSMQMCIFFSMKIGLPTFRLFVRPHSLSLQLMPKTYLELTFDFVQGPSGIALVDLNRPTGGPVREPLTRSLSLADQGREVLGRTIPAQPCAPIIMGAPSVRPCMKQFQIPVYIGTSSIATWSSRVETAPR